jgi:hypothetical protein
MNQMIEQKPTKRTKVFSFVAFCSIPVLPTGLATQVQSLCVRKSPAPTPKTPHPSNLTYSASARQTAQYSFLVFQRVCNAVLAPCNAVLWRVTKLENFGVEGGQTA